MPNCFAFKSPNYVTSTEIVELLFAQVMTCRGTLQKPASEKNVLIYATNFFKYLNDGTQLFESVI